MTCSSEVATASTSNNTELLSAQQAGKKTAKTLGKIHKTNQNRVLPP